MSLRRLSRRSPNAEQVGVGYIHGHQLKIHKIGQDGSAKADALYTGDLDHRVFGVLYELTQEDRNALDLAEGLGHGYVDRVVKVTDIEGVSHEAFTYIALMVNADLKPYCWYKEHLIRGAKEGGLPPAYIAQIEKFDCDPDPDSERRSREISIYTEGH